MSADEVGIRLVANLARMKLVALGLAGDSGHRSKR